MLKPTEYEEGMGAPGGRLQYKRFVEMLHDIRRDKLKLMSIKFLLELLSVVSGVNFSQSVIFMCVRDISHNAHVHVYVCVR